ncbi:tail fiber assembly protein [Pragia fontium]|uniref:tail fiber assembly protein n=1 Tax=Pragia fontium TaxID=82985 RepID=UPI000F6FC3FA|nr:tail fiber assembly protein [Pragia fontium]VEJ54298.1 Caudovirales tail fibre assembly protein [Pragia fontium]
MSYFYSAHENAFFPAKFKEAYIAANTWPEDLLEVSVEIFNQYSIQPPEGKIRVAGVDGLPTWISIPEPIKTQYVATAEIEKYNRISEANRITQTWQTQLILGIISEQDREKLTNWMLYLQAVQAIETQAAPDIDWPKAPAA